MIIMKYAKYIACLTVALLLTVELFAQTAVSGRITDKNGESVIGATILVKGTTTGTSSDAEGRYKIVIPATAEKTLQVSYLGYKPQEIAVGTRTRIDIELESDEAQIEEVVVVGYGTLRKSDVTGAVTSVKIDKNEAAQVASFDKLLQGHAAGVQVTTGNAAPGGAVSVKIRGTSSFNGTGEPLYVVDGIILNPSSQDVKNPLGSTGQEAQNALASISPQDIASMEILKDASATAIYGSMGANGVVLITKQGTSDTPRIEFSTMVDISTPRKHIDVLDLDQFLAYSDDVGVSLDIKEGEVLEARDWQDYTMRNAVSINTRVSVSGRSDKSNYYLAGGYLDNNGIIRNTNVRQYDFRANFDHRIAKFIKVGTKTTVSNRKNQMTQGTEPGGTQNATRATSMIRQMLGSKPYVTTSGEDLGDEEDYKGTDLWLNSYEDGSDEFRLSGSLYADIRLTKWLSFKTTFGTDYRNKNRTRFYGQYLDNGLNGRAGFSELVAFRYNVDNMFNINKSFKGGHRIDAVLGISVNSAENHNSTINAGLPRLPGPRIPLRRDQQRQNAGSGIFRGRKHADVLHRPHGLQLQGPLRADGHVPRRRQQQVLQGEPLQLLPLVFGGMAHVRREIHEEPEFHLQPQAARRLGHGRQSGPEPLPDADHLQLDVYGRPQFGLFGIARRPVRHRHQAQHHVQPGAQMGDHRAV